jgi:hypothetical protein
VVINLYNETTGGHSPARPPAAGVGQHPPEDGTGAISPIIMDFTHCYSLDVECLPKAHVLETWAEVWHYWKVMEALRSEASWDVFRSLTCSLRDSGTSVLSSFSLYFAVR